MKRHLMKAFYAVCLIIILCGLFVIHRNYSAKTTPIVANKKITLPLLDPPVAVTPNTITKDQSSTLSTTPSNSTINSTPLTMPVVCPTGLLLVYNQVLSKYNRGYLNEIDFLRNNLNQYHDSTSVDIVNNAIPVQNDIFTKSYNSIYGTFQELNNAGPSCSLNPVAPTKHTIPLVNPAYWASWPPGI